jgi:penicillin-binding protein 1A
LNNRNNRNPDRRSVSIPLQDLQNTLMPKRMSSFPFRVYRVILIALVSLVILVSTASYLWLNALGVFSINESSVAAILTHTPVDNTIVYDREQNVIGEYFDRYHIYVPYNKIPPMMLKSILAIEDRGFFRHPGIDIKAIMRASLDVLMDGEFRQGASTLTQQLVRNFLLSREKTMGRKIKEMALALYLEKKLSKQRILELYCNNMFLGNGAYGLGAAAERYFNRKLEDLQPHEMALLAGLFQSPSRYNPMKAPELALRRQKQVIRALHRSRFISRAKALQMMSAPLAYHNYQPVNTSLAPHFIDYIRETARDLANQRQIKNKGWRIYTTLDSKLQVAANETFAESTAHFDLVDSWIEQKWKPKKEDRTTSEAALLSVDPRNGDVLAMIGGRDYKKSQFNRAYRGLRSPGSSFKPVIYSLALAKGRTWSDVFFVSPISINGYRPKNYNQDELMQETSLLRAFYRSLNTVAVEIGNELGISNVIRHAQKLGVSSKLKEEPGLFLGSSDVTMKDMAQLYSTIAGNGNFIPMNPIIKITTRKGKVLYEREKLELRKTQALAPEISSLMTDGLRNVFRYGTAASQRHLAKSHGGKTGTSNDSQDNWFCGFSPDMVSIVWAGVDDNSPMRRPASGASVALPLWTTYTEKTSQFRPPVPFRYDPKVRATRIDPKFGHKDYNGIPMYFVRGTEPKRRTSDFKQSATTGGHRDLFSH